MNTSISPVFPGAAMPSASAVNAAGKTDGSGSFVALVDTTGGAPAEAPSTARMATTRQAPGQSAAKGGGSSADKVALEGAGLPAAPQPEIVAPAAEDAAAPTGEDGAEALPDPGLATPDAAAALAPAPDGPAAAAGSAAEPALVAAEQAASKITPAPAEQPADEPASDLAVKPDVEVDGGRETKPVRDKSGGETAEAIPLPDMPMQASLAAALPAATGQAGMQAAAVQASLAGQAVQAAPVQDESPASDVPAAGLAATSRKAKSAGAAHHPMQTAQGSVAGNTAVAGMPEVDIAAEGASGAQGGGERTAAATGSTGKAVDLASAGASTGMDGSALSSQLLSQAMAGAGSARPAALPYPSAQTAAADAPTISVKEGTFGTDLGVQIARSLDKGGEDLLIKLDPRHLGRIDVRLSFSHDGTLRAVVSADTATATDMLRRESGDLNRALADAGIRADGQSLRFDTRSGGQNGHGGGQQWSSGSSRMADTSGSGIADTPASLPEPAYRSLGSSGHIDLMA